MKSRKVEKSKSGNWGAFALAALCAGCGVDFGYILPVIGGQAEVLLRSVPLAEALRSAALTDDEKAKLILIRDVRDYAGDVIGLDIRDNYTTYYDSGGEPVAYNISASAKDRFAPKIWSFPLVGSVPYLGYFDRGQAFREFNELGRLGYDVFMYPVEAYTGIEGVPNPVFSGLLARDEIAIVDAIFHELLHSTVSRPDDATFNESLATFVGQTAMLEYLAARQPGWIQAATDRIEDVDRYNAFIFELYADLEAYYAGDESRERKIAGREAVFQAGRERFKVEVQPLMKSPAAFEWVQTLPANNAWMLANHRYNLDLDLFGEVYAATGSDWRESLRTFGRAARSRDPYAFLRAWLAGDESKLGESEAPMAAELGEPHSDHFGCALPPVGRLPTVP